MTIFLLPQASPERSFGPERRSEEVKSMRSDRYYAEKNSLRSDEDMRTGESSFIALHSHVLRDYLPKAALVAQDLILAPLGGTRKDLIVFTSRCGRNNASHGAIPCQESRITHFHTKRFVWKI